MIDAKVIELARRGLRPVLEKRVEELGESIVRIQSEFAVRGTSQSTMAAQAVQKRCAQEVAQAVEIAWKNLWRVLSNLRLASEELEAERLKGEIREEIAQHLGIVESILREKATLAAGAGFAKEMVAALRWAIERAFAAADAEIDLFVHAAAAARERSASTAAAPTFNIYSPVGAIQTGPHATATIIQNLGTDERRALDAALKVLQESLNAVRETTGLNSEELIEITVAARAELEKSKPNGSLLASLLAGLATAVQTVGALEPAYTTLKAAAAAVGITLP